MKGKIHRSQKFWPFCMKPLLQGFFQTACWHFTAENSSNPPNCSRTICFQLSFFTILEIWLPEKSSNWPSFCLGKPEGMYSSSVSPSLIWRAKALRFKLSARNHFSSCKVLSLMSSLLPPCSLPRLSISLLSRDVIQKWMHCSECGLTTLEEKGSSDLHLFFLMQLQIALRLWEPLLSGNTSKGD